MSAPISPAPPIPEAPIYRTFGHLVSIWEKLMYVTGAGRPPVTEVDRRIPVRVDTVCHEADDVVSLDLVPTDRGRLPRWDPGAHVDLLLPSGRMRQYSLTGEPDNRAKYRIAVRRIPAVAGGLGGSREVHSLRAGDEVVLKGPRNAFPFVTAPSYHFVAGGIGITPIMPMVRAAAARGDEWRLVYTGSTQASMPFLGEIEEFASDFPGRVHVWPDDQHGPPDPARIVQVAPPRAALYCCGPPPMIAAIRAMIPTDPIDTLHYERFSPLPVIAGEPFTIKLASTGQEIPVSADQSALAALRTVHPSIAYSCQQGFCGTCPVRVVTGAVQHQDRCLTDDLRNEVMAPCVSRGVGTITLDL